MSEDLVKNFIKLFSMDWGNPESIEGFKKLLSKAKKAGDTSLASIVEARLASSKGNHEKALNLLEPLLSGDSPNPFALLMRARILCNDMEDYEESLQDYTRIIDEPLADSKYNDLIMAFASYGKGVALIKLNHHEDAISACDEMVKRFGKREELVLLEQVAKAMFNKGVILGQLNRHEEAISICDEVVKRFGEREELELLELFAMSLVNKSVVLGNLNRLEEAVSIYDEVVKRFGKREELVLLEQVAKAMFNKGVILGQLNHHEEAISSYDEVVKRFRDREGLELPELVAKALVNKGVALENMNRHEDSISAYDNVVERFGKEEKSVLLENVAKALFNKAAILRKIEKPDEAVQLLRGIPEIFSHVDPKTSEFWLDFFARVARQLVDITLGRPEKRDKDVIKWCLEKTKPNVQANLDVLLAIVLKYIDKDKKKEFFDAIQTARSKTDSFIKDDSRFNPDLSFLVVLREWNSYTPALPAQEEADRGGGYFIRHGGEGIVIDPGYDFIDNFARAGGRLRDIQHIIVTHAHDDHTANLEPLLMLFYRLRNPESSDVAMAREIPRDIRKNTQVSLYLSESVQRKFSGLLRLKDSMFRRIVTLSNPGENENQVLRLNEKTTLIVLPAYHDDVISMELAVGFLLDCRLADNSICRIVFTGDTGLYPRLLNERGTPVYYTYKDSNNITHKEPEVDDSEGKALFERYEAILGGHKPDLLVAHIGSIKEQEFPSEHFTYAEQERHLKPSRRFYVNHLGMLGSLMLMYKLAPRAVVISEFGLELKDIRIELVCRLAEALHDKQQEDDPTTDKTFVTPGDLTILYNIETHQFLCHSNCRFKDCSALKVEPACNYSRQLDSTTGKYDSVPKKDYKRAYLFPASSKRTEAEHNDYAKKFFEKLFNCKLPIHKKK